MSKPLLAAAARLLLASAITVASGCVGPGSSEQGSSDEDQAQAVQTAQFGVFYGGQVQQLRAVAWPREGHRPTLGFRLILREAQAEDLRVRWEVDVPSRTAPGQRVQRVSEARLPRGQVRLDQEIVVPPGAELGLWNVRVIVAERLVLDRAVRLYDSGSAN